MKTKLTHKEVVSLAASLASTISEYVLSTRAGSGTTIIKIYAVPRGGIPVAYLLGNALSRYAIQCKMAEDPLDADIFVDDLIDSGSTMRKYCDEYPGIPFFALIDKTTSEVYKNVWIVFPWEVTSKGEDESATDAVVRMMQFIGENPEREGLAETPARVVKAWKHWFSGYGKDAKTLLKVFEDGAENYDQMVLVKDIPIYSHCEHHIAPIIGTVSIAYIPNGKIVGLSKLSRLADMFARRLQVQERLTDQIADALVEHLNPIGVGVIIKARHLCMESRGVCQQGHHTVTTSLRGAIKDDAQARSEFLSLSK
jgi:GTP cyclohydrolase I